MCSIIGCNFEIKDLEYVNHFLKFRGPDHTSVHTRESWQFVQNLLSITGDFTPQPFTSDDGNIVCIFNGEIYNYDELGDYKSDGECLIPLYEKYGFDFVKHLDGEFAILIVDFSKRIILASTDVFSTKPLWLGKNGDKIMFASYESALERANFRNRFKMPANKAVVFDLETIKPIYNTSLYVFDLNQHKESYDDWLAAWKSSIYKRTKNIRERIFIGLSSGYDSGAMACELQNQGVDFKTYTIEAEETKHILSARFRRHNKPFEYVRFTRQRFEECKKILTERCENFTYRFYNHQESVYSDKASAGMAHICSLANEDNIKIYLSGQGADEIYGDYGFGGRKIYQHSSFGGQYPQDLENHFPWRSFYEGTQVSYLAKEESVSGGFGIEGRYPFLDTKLVQEFLWLSNDLKNKTYKSVIHEYLKENNYPFDEGVKIGFSCDKNLKES